MRASALRILVVAAITLDTVTYAMMPPGHEVNPLIVAGGWLALALRWVIMVGLFALLAIAERHEWPYFDRLARPGLLLCAAAGTIGATSNTLVIAFAR